MSDVARTMFDKVWEDHVVVPETDETPAVLYVDLHLLHEVTSPQAFTMLRERELGVRRPDLALAMMDHSIPTRPRGADGRVRFANPQTERQVRTLAENCAEHRIELLDMDSADRGIVHVVGPELGLSWPGKVIVCGDSHTSTHGAFGALAFGIGTTEVGHVLATQCLLQRRPKTMAIEVSGRLGRGVTAKDLALSIIAEIGVDGGAGHAIEYRGEAIRELSVEGRATLCNMSIEAGARAGMVAPDQETIEYLRGRPRVPVDFDVATARWRELATDTGAEFDRIARFDAASLQPVITYGTTPGMVTEIDAPLPDRPEDPQLCESLRYMGLQPGEVLAGRPIDVVFIGSCTNARIEDLRAAAGLLAGRRVRARTLVVPGSERVKREAEGEGLERVFLEAGAEWREPGCSMCIAMNGDRVEPGQYAVSTSNRNFPGRQGVGARTFLASPLTAAAAALEGRITDPRELLR